MIEHHPSETTLLAYAAGSLPQALALVAATHLSHCAACRRTVGVLEAAGGSVLADLPPAMMEADALNQVLGRLDEVPPPPVPVLNPALPAPLNRTQLGRSWPIGPGLRWRPLIAQGGAWGGLLLAQPKRRLPSHGHAGLELTCVISGAFRDGSGIYGAGDLSEPEADHDDPPVVHGDEPCLCVIATEGMRFRGALGWAQRVLLRQ